MLTVTTSKRIVYNRMPYELLVSENYYVHIVYLITIFTLIHSSMGTCEVASFITKYMYSLH